MAKKKEKVKLERCNYEAQEFCFREGYRVYPSTDIDNKVYKVHIDRGVDKFVIATEHTSATIHQALWDAYQLIYDKKNGKT